MLLMVCMYILLILKNIIQTVKNKLFFELFQTEKIKHYLAVKKLSASFRGINSKHHGDFYCLNCFYSKANFHRIKENLKIKIFVM